MKILWVATKMPWPPRDGGRLVQKLTLEALADQGVEVTVVAPVAEDSPAGDWLPERLPSGLRLEPVEVQGPTRLRTAWRVLLGEPWTLAAHRRRRVEGRVGELVAAGSYDLVHAEQLQAWPQTAPARRRGLPAVLRAQNVESDLWRGMAELEGTGAVRARVFRWQGRRLARWEARVVAEADRVVTLTEPDRERLRQLAEEHTGEPLPTAEVVAVPTPFPSRLPAAERRLEGEPPVVLLGSGGWPPNRDAEVWMLRDLWPRVRQELPGAVLHAFGGGGGGREVGSEALGEEGVVRHPAPEDSRDAFAPGSVLVVPLRLASGVRMKILEAWARGLPVVATAEAVRGLGGEPDREALEARDAGTLASALERLRGDGSEEAKRLVRAGHRRLEEAHDSGAVAERLCEVYRNTVRKRGAD